MVVYYQERVKQYAHLVNCIPGTKIQVSLILGLTLYILQRTEYVCYCHQSKEKYQI